MTSDVTQGELIASPPSQTDTTPLTVMSIVKMAVEKDIDVDKLEKLLQMVRDVELDEARKSYFKAKSGFQSDLPDIPYDCQAATGSATWRYASLGAILKAIKPFLKVWGLSLKFSYSADNTVLTCTVTHKDGFFEESSFSCSIDGQAGALVKMTNQMRAGSADTYAKRRTLTAVLAIGTVDEDTDGVGAIPAEGPAKKPAQKPAQKPVSSPKVLIMQDWVAARPGLNLPVKTKAQTDLRRQLRIVTFGKWFTEYTKTPFKADGTPFTNHQINACRDQLTKEKEIADACVVTEDSGVDSDREREGNDTGGQQRESEGGD